MKFRDGLASQRVAGSMVNSGRNGLRLWVTLSLLPILLLLNACGSGGDGNANLFALFVGPAQTMDAGQTTTVTASIVNDTTPGGATFSVTGGGTLSAPSTTTVGSTEKVSVVYTAPSTATIATVIATSVHTPAQSYSVVITVHAALVITTTSFPTGSTGTTYDVTPAATGGTGTLTWSVASGALPAGLSLNPANGEVSGTPTTAGTSTFTLAVTDSAPTPAKAVQTYNVTINPPAPTVSTNSLANGLVGTGYSQQLAYTGGGTGTVSWAITSGSLPSLSGLTFSSTGLISGTPTAAGTYQFSVAVTVGTQTSAAVALSIKVLAPVVITTTSLPSGHINVAYSQQLAYTGGDGSTPTWTIVSGSLPSTLTLSSSGLLAGTPTAAGTYTFGVAVTVGSLTSATATFTLPVLSTTITSGTTAYGEVGLPFAFQLTAISGTAPYTFSLASGSNALPTGLSINASTGQISGTPTTSSGSPYSGVIVQVKDTLGATGTQSMSFTISASRGNAANGELSGQYAFELSGFDSLGNPVASAGVFTANGSGNITSGAIDTNGTAMSAPTANVALTASTYAVGADGRGQLALNTAAGNASYIVAVNTISGGVATGGAMTEFDATGRRLSGQFARQTTTAFHTASINSGFAFGAYGFTAGSSATSLGRSGTIGEIQFAGVSAVTSSEITSSNGSSTTPVVPSAGTLTVGSNGRGTLSLGLPGTAGTLDFYVYVVSTSEMYLLSSDAASGTGLAVRDLLLGDARAQTITTGTFTASSLSGSSVFYEQKLGVSGATTYYPDVQMGLYTFDGAGNVLGSEDRNAGGTATQATLGGTYTVATNGRVIAYVAATGLSGCLDCAKPASVFYLVGAGQGFLLDFATSGGTGAFAPQTQTSFTSSALTGSYSLGTQDPVTTGVVPESGLIAISSSTLTGLLDQAVAGVPTPDVALSGTLSVGANGRVALTGSSNAVVYLYSPNQGLWLDLTSVAPTVRPIVHQ